MIETQQSICAWADETFGPPISDASIAARALVEMAGLVTACVNGAPAEVIGTEIADVVIVLARLGRSLDHDVVRDPPYWPRQNLLAQAAKAVQRLGDVMAADNTEWRRTNLTALRSNLGDIAAILGVSVPAAIDSKMAINRARRWKLDGCGHGQHVREG